MTRIGRVYLVGAGPGDPGLITVKGRDCLRRADVVVYDYLANPALLAEAPPAAERIYVGKSRGRHQLPQEEINALLAERARRGKIVVRLKGGDPYVFGRGGEEALHLREQGIAFEVVPGVSAGFAAAAYAGIPLTHRDYTTSLGLVTGHENPEKKMSRLDWEKLAGGVGTLVFYMGMANLELITRELVRHGRSPRTPVAIVRWATTPRQQTLTGTLADIVAKVRAADFKPPAVIIVGAVVELRQHLAWFEERPLFGRRLLITRAAEQAAVFQQMLEARGAEVLSVPTITTRAPQDWGPVDAGIAALPNTDFLVLTSTNAVDFFFARLRDLGLDARALGGVRLVAVGPKTAAALSERGLRADLVPESFQAEGVVELLRAVGVAGKRVFYPHAELARDLIARELRALGAEVDAPVLYRTLMPEQGGAELRALLEKRALDAVIFTASSTLENFVRMVGEDAAHLLEGVALASIGPPTTRTAQKFGLTVHVEPAHSTLDDLIEALVDYFTRTRHEPGMAHQG
ncbi:uroporphyrinogen-III C-methyltransferase [Geoalkalibacter halelectricus]|uniref:uroporphyrinogen-III C-methyltransferase n=1 Tax=Geoalkalibacter halelectricus TaxID=2847045 RepID=A0ABY5ZJI0_9BACT|nr:uroporphyrinogen-III C-methyltransferase [Geoalkalibacter halelectricus]MDO3377882.1 uroporphyrinogen-III C-methyltransferase [Geoalkalibacter halelectricus]UWZ77935.1 uroporphyrinogen-III C-methyltransferase [Geoalkalibacter halelectricus]